MKKLVIIGIKDEAIQWPDEAIEGLDEFIQWFYDLIQVLDEVIRKPDVIIQVPDEHIGEFDESIVGLDDFIQPRENQKISQKTFRNKNQIINRSGLKRLHTAGRPNTTQK